MNMTGQQLDALDVDIALLQPEEFLISENDKTLIAHYKTCKGDVLEYIFTSPKKAIYADLAKRLWTELIQENYKLLEKQHLVYLPPEVYWQIYKRVSNGREHMRGTGYTLKVNDVPYHFPSTQFYFSKAEIEAGGERGVYAIKYDDDILYVGSSGSGLIDIWKQHNACFKAGNGPNQMYRAQYLSEKVEYVTLKTATELAELLGYSNSSDVPTWLLEVVEMTYIDAYKPRYNIQGVSEPFQLNPKARVMEWELPKNYWRIVKNFLDKDMSLYDKNLEEVRQILAQKNE